MKKLLASLLAISLVATTVATPLGENLSNKVVNTSISAKADYEDDYDDDYRSFKYQNFECYSYGDGITISKYIGSETNVTIPATIDDEQVRYIDNDAFKECNTLKEVTIPGSVKYIYSNAFRECENLEKVTLEVGIREINSYAFVGLEKLKTITIPKSVTYIGERAFGFDIEYGEEEGDYDYIYVNDFSMNVYDKTTGYYYAQDYEDLKYNVLPNDDIGVVNVTNINQFKSPHNAPAYMNKTWRYTIPNAEGLKITFSDKTNLAYNDYDGNDYINIYSFNMDSYDSEYDEYSTLFKQSYYNDNLAGKTIIVPGDTVDVNLYTYSDQSYGFDVVKVEKASDNEIVIDRNLTNNYLAFVQRTDGNFHLNKNDYDYTRLLYNTTSFASYGVDEDKGILGDDIPYYQLCKSEDSMGIIGKANKNKIEIEQSMKFEKNLATGQEDVLKLEYTYTNTDTISHDVGCHIFFDTMIGENDSAPFRVPGVGDITTGTVFEGKNVPMYWQAFDELENPSVIAQGRFYKDKANAPDKVIFGSYSDLNYSWSEEVNVGEDNGDSAVAMFWNERPLAPGESITFTTYYGLSDLTQDLNGDLTLSVTGDKFAGQIDYDENTYLPTYNDVIFTAYAKNTTDSDIKNVVAKIDLPEGFSLINEPGNTQVKTVDSISSEEIKQFDWKVKIDPSKVEELRKYDINVSLNADNVDGKTLNRSITIPETLVEKTNINEVEIVNDKKYTYTGEPITPDITLKNGETELVENVNYTVEYQNNVNAGTAKAIFKGIGMYNGQVEAEYVIDPITTSTLRTELDNNEFIYTGSNITPVVKSLKDSNEKSWNLDNFNISYSDNLNVGTAYVTIEPKNNNFSGTKTISYLINKKDVDDLTANLDNDTFTFDGEEKEPAVSVKYNDITLVKDVDYTVSYEDNTNAGTATVIINGIGNYSGTKTVNFTIDPKDVDDLTANLDNDTFTFDGNVKEPVVSVKYNDITLVKDVDYTVSYEDNTSAGTATVTINGIGNYSGTTTKTFKINSKNISSSRIKLSKSTFIYNGKVQKPTITVYDGNNILKINRDYKLTYSNSKNPGIYKYTVTGIANYTGTKSVTYTITPSQTTGLKASSNSTSSLKLSWKKVVGAKGYEIYQNGKKIKSLTGTSLTVKKLKAGTTYKFTVKAYTKSGTKTVYGNASKTLTTSTKSSAVSLKVTTGKKKATLKWSKVTGATNYVVYYKTSAKGKWVKLKSASAKTTSYTKTKLTSKKTYWFKVDTVRKVGKTTFTTAGSTKSVKIK